MVLEDAESVRRYLDPLFRVMVSISAIFPLSPIGPSPSSRYGRNAQSPAVDARSVAAPLH